MTIERLTIKAQLYTFAYDKCNKREQKVKLEIDLNCQPINWLRAFYRRKWVKKCVWNHENNIFRLNLRCVSQTLQPIKSHWQKIPHFFWPLLKLRCQENIHRQKYSKPRSIFTANRAIHTHCLTILLYCLHLHRPIYKQTSHIFY